MRFPADENCDFAVVRALRAAGHDVTAIVEVSPQAEDEHIIDLSIARTSFTLTLPKHNRRCYGLSSQAGSLRHKVAERHSGAARNRVRIPRFLTPLKLHRARGIVKSTGNGSMVAH